MVCKRLFGAFSFRSSDKIGAPQQKPDGTQGGNCCQASTTKDNGLMLFSYSQAPTNTPSPAFPNYRNLSSHRWSTPRSSTRTKSTSTRRSSPFTCTQSSPASPIAQLWPWQHGSGHGG